jgi:hypothetical protein
MRIWAEKKQTPSCDLPVNKIKYRHNLNMSRLETPYKFVRWALSKLYFVKIPANTKEKLGQVFVHMGEVGEEGPCW